MTTVERLAYSVAEAAAALGISRSKVYALMDAGTLPFVKLGRTRHISRRALDDLVSASPPVDEVSQ
jgi:excisionase family DNA binding protein